MKVIGCQLDIAWENKQANHDRAHALLEAARPEPGSLLVLPEMFATGFSMNVAATAEGEDGPTHSFLSAVAAEYRCHVVGGVVTQGTGGRGRNECVVYGPAGEEVSRYCKIHPFAPGNEAEHYHAGDAPRLFQWQGFTVAPFICYDLRFPEIFREAVRQGATLFTVIANWPVARVLHWTTLLQARAIENQAYVVGVNRVGEDPTLRYNGQSMVVDHAGVTLARAEEQEQVIQAEVEPAALAEYRQRLPFLQDMRSEFFV